MNSRLKRLIFFLSFSFVILLFFQNFSFFDKSKSLKQGVEKFLPQYSVVERLANMEVPLGYSDYIKNKITSDSSVKIFDQRKYVKEAVEKTPIFKDIKDFIDSDTMDFEEPCSTNPSEALNNCYADSINMGPVQQSNEDLKFKVRGNPLRQVASVQISGPVESTIRYNQDEQNISIEVNQEIDPNTRLKFEVNSQNQEGRVNLNMSW